MIGDKKILAIIPARGGSKGLPGKNIMPLGGKPLIGWTIDAALNTNFIDKTIVSTDCQEISKVAVQLGASVPFIRPDEFSSDESTAVSVVYHALNTIDDNFDVIVLLQPTSPFRSEKHIRESLELYFSESASSVVSVCESDKSPYWCFWRNDNNSITPILSQENQFSRRQDLKKAFSLNGAIYILDVKKFINERKFIFEDSLSYVMDKESSVDIDDMMDLQLAQVILGAK